MNLTIEEALSDCVLCPRCCHADRLHGQAGFCGETAVLRAARAALYYTEEPVISGRRGSGTVFFTGCNLGCIYCQNRQISRPQKAFLTRPDKEAVQPRTAMPDDQAAQILPAQHRNPSGDAAPHTVAAGSAGNYPQLSPERLTEIFFELEDQGAHNINLVTPEHFVPLLIPALRRAKKQGLSIPVVYNTGSYERVEAVRALEGLVDVWLPDLKYVSSELSARHTGAADYFPYASAAIAEMVRQCPEPVFSDGSHAIDCPDDADDPLLVRGVLVRHLALPGCGEDSRAVLRYLHETYGDRIFISIMNQYTPIPQVLLRQEDRQRSAAGSRFSPPGQPGHLYPGINADSCSCIREEECGAVDSALCRRLTDAEYDSLVDYAIDIGIENGFIQESGTVSPSYIPIFDGTGI